MAKKKILNGPNGANGTKTQPSPTHQSVPQKNWRAGESKLVGDLMCEMLGDSICFKAQDGQMYLVASNLSYSLENTIETNRRSTVFSLPSGSPEYVFEAIKVFAIDSPAGLPHGKYFAVNFNDDQQYGQFINALTKIKTAHICALAHLEISHATEAAYADLAALHDRVDLLELPLKSSFVANRQNLAGALNKATFLPSKAR
jgi:hypothetical protein